MTNTIISKTMLLFLIGLFLTTMFEFVSAQSMSIEQIKKNLLSNPPNTGNSVIRKESIISLDTMLISDSARTAKSILNFYTSMIQKVDTELASKVNSGASIWMMYNHGYLVKTPGLVFAFDLTQGYAGWSKPFPESLIPFSVIDQIKVLFVSHAHVDHINVSIIYRVKLNGGYVVYPKETPGYGNFPMAANDSIELEGLHIKAYSGVHDLPVRIYEVVTPNGLKFLHTGDSGPTQSLPQVNDVDVLLLNANTNDDRSTMLGIGLRTGVNKLNPKIMIPGHIQELWHPAGRLSYQDAYRILEQDTSIAAKTHVMTWGELYEITEDVSSVLDGKVNSLPQVFQLHQNYPNPFNSTTTINYSIPKTSFVRIKVYDVLGNEVETIVNEEKSIGNYTLVFNGNKRASGIYFCRMETGNICETKKIVLLK